MSLVSIVVPVYNVEKYLRECLESLRCQTLEDIEIVCVDDGSTDGSLSILKEYEALDSRFVVISKPNAGYGHTMNCGFRAARAPYVGVLESDDFCTPSMCEQLCSLAIENNLDIVRADLSFYWTDDVSRTRRACYINKDDCGFVFDPHEKKDCFCLPPALCCMLFKKRLILDNELKLLETPGASFQDTSFSFKLWACAKRAMITDQAFVLYRQDNESSSINQTDKIYCVNEEYRELERFLEEGDLRFAALLPIMMRRRYSAYLWNYKRIDVRFHNEYVERIAREFRNAQDGLLLEQDLFSSEEWSDISLLISDPILYVERMDAWSIAKIKLFHAKAKLTRKLNL